MEKPCPSQTFELSSFQHGCIGAFVGSVEQAIMRPSVYWKAELQQDRFTWSRAVNPRYLYRGLPVAVASIAPITCIQFATTNIFVKAVSAVRGSSKGTPTPETDTMVAGVVAGATSSLAQSPFQLVEINQQRSGGNMVATAQKVICQDGLLGLWRGGTMTGLREGIFCCSYIAVAPYLKRTLLQRRPDMSATTALAASSIVSGSLGAVLSHPFDTLKTRIQGSVFDAQRASGPWEALERLRHSGPGSLASKCYKGLSPRLFRLVCCTFIYGSLSDAMEGYIIKMYTTPLWQKSGVHDFLRPEPRACPGASPGACPAAQGA